jgi:hypothetical protein
MRGVLSVSEPNVFEWVVIIRFLTEVITSP